MNTEERREARRKAQEARERAEKAMSEFACSVQSLALFGRIGREDVPELADLIDALVGELEKKSRRVDKLEVAMRAACIRFYADGSDGEAANEMRLLLEAALSGGKEGEA